METVAIAFDPNEWGTVAAWVTGLLTVVFAYLAWSQAKNAAHWARIATEAEQKSNYLFEMARTVEVELSIQRTPTGTTPTRTPAHVAETVVVIALSAESDTIWVQDVIIWWASFCEADKDGRGQVLLDTDNIHIQPFDGEYDTPFQLRPGQRLEVPNPLDLNLNGRYVDPSRSSCFASVRYSFDRDVEYRIFETPEGDPDNAYPTVHEIPAEMELKDITRQWSVG